MSEGDHHYLIRGGIEGRERLRVLSRVMRPGTQSLLERAGLGAGMRVLDVGCGGGDVTFDLAALVGITGHVVGLDVDPVKLELARGDAEQAEVTNVEFRVADLTDGLGEAEYDVVFARFVTWALSDPDGALAQMLAAVRPGGRLVVEDIDFRGSSCTPESADFLRYEQVFTGTARLNGGDPWYGGRLPQALVDAGVRDVQTNIVTPAALEGEVKALPAISLENIRAMVLKHGTATAEELDHLVDALYAIARDPTTYVTNPRVVQAWGFRGVHRP